MSQVGVSRPASQLKMGFTLPEIQHPLTRMSFPRNLDVRGVSRSGDRPFSNPPGGRPLPSENNNFVRKSVSATGRSSRMVRESPVVGGSVPIASIPEGVEVKYGDPNATRLPVFGSRAGVADKDVPASRASTRLSRASTQERIEIDELEAILKEKVKNNYYEVRKRFKDNDPEGRGNVSREAFLRILVTVLGRSISQSQSVKLMERLGMRDRIMIPFTDFFSHFREPQEFSNPQWMDPVNRPDRVLMNANQVHSHLKAKVRQRFIDLADVFPQLNPGGAQRIMRGEFQQMLNRMSFYMDESEFNKLWHRYDPANEGIIDGKRFLHSLGIEWRSAVGERSSPVQHASLNQGVGRLQVRKNTAGEKGKVRLAPIQEKDHSEREQQTHSESGQRTPRKREIERKQQLDVERWLKEKFREGFFNMRKAFEDKDTEKTGTVKIEDFLEVLSQFGLRLEKSLLGAFLSRCSVQIMGRNVPYREFLHRFQDRSESGMVHNVLTDVKHKFNNRPTSPGGESTVSAIEGQLINMFQRDFLALLGMFKKIDRLGAEHISQEEFRAAIESRFNLELTDGQFEAFLDRVPLDDDGNILYAKFMQQFDTRGQAPSLFAPLPEEPVGVAGKSSPVQEEPTEENEQTSAVDPVPDVEDLDEQQTRRSTQELFKVIKELMSKKFQDVEQAFFDLDEWNSRRLSQEMMYQLLKKFDIKPEITRGEIRDLWRTFITNADRTLDYYQFIRHFGFSLRSAAFPNAKLNPPRRGDADFMMRSRKLNCAADMLQDSLRSKIDYLWDDLRKEFQSMDPFNTGCVSRDEFRDVLIELCVHLSDTELESIITKFDTRQDDRISYVEFLKPFALRKQTWRHGNNMLSLLQHPQPALPLADIGDPPQKGLNGITSKLRQKLVGEWKNIRRAFRKLDANGSGYLSLPEFRSVLKLANVILDEDDVYNMMTSFDHDLSGKIPYEKIIDETFKPASRRSVKRSA